MIDLDIVREFVLEHLPMVKITKRGTHFQTRCVLCGDSKKSPTKSRFHLDWNKGNPMWHCFNCERSGSFIPLYAEVTGQSKEKIRSIIFDHHTDEYKKRASKAKKKLSDKKEYKLQNGTIKKVNSDIPTEPLTVYHDYLLKYCVSHTDNPTGYITKNLQKELKEFLSNRKLPEHVKVYAAYEGRYRNRFIIPVYEENRIVYFQARRINKYIEPKYLNPGAEKERIILNKEKFNRNKHIIVTEGLIDAFMIPNQGTASLGASISKTFIKELDKLTDKSIIIFFDNDEAGRKAFNKFTDGEYGNIFKDNVKYFRFPDKYKRHTDLNEIVTNEKIEDVYEFIVSNSYNLVTVSALIQIEKVKQSTVLKRKRR